MSAETSEEILSRRSEYKYGFTTDIETDELRRIYHSAT
ncbi:MAG: hypothetical protein K940chlam3_01375 [Chlamydiae bacterium]|nr:hypothetical protein [Chlamydiota bacterium]